MTPDQLRELEALTIATLEPEEAEEEERPSIHGKTPPPPGPMIPGEKPVALKQGKRIDLPSRPEPEQKEPPAPKPLKVNASARPDIKPRHSWPFAKMALGHWFAVENRDDFHRARLAASAYGKRNGKRFVCNIDMHECLIVKRAE